MQKNKSQDDVTTVKNVCLPEIDMAGASILGTRKYQQDAYYMLQTDIGSLGVICDGMGGMDCGEKASQGAVERLWQDFKKLSGEENLADFLIEEATVLDQLVAELEDDSGNNIEAGTTVVAVIARGNKLCWLSVGDSRIYIIRGEQMLCVTRAHNYGYRLEQKLKKGEISKLAYEEEQDQAEALISYLGMNGLELIDGNSTPFELEYGDRILLCSDGLYKCLPQEVLERILLQERAGVRETVAKIIVEVEKSPKKNKDNTTVILLAYE